MNTGTGLIPKIAKSSVQPQADSHRCRAGVSSIKKGPGKFSGATELQNTCFDNEKDQYPGLGVNLGFFWISVAGIGIRSLVLLQGCLAVIDPRTAVAKALAQLRMKFSDEQLMSFLILFCSKMISSD